MVEVEDSSLLLSPEEAPPQQKFKRATIPVKKIDSPESIVRLVVSAYISGYTLIKLKSQDTRIDTEVKLAVKELSRNKFVGTEILSEAPDELTLQVLLRHKELTITDALKRIANITASMYRDAYQAIRNEDADLAKIVIELDDEVDRFSLYCNRLLKLAITNPQLSEDIGVVNIDQCLGYRSIVRIIERTADHAVNIAKNQIPANGVTSNTLDNIANAGQLALNIFESSVEAALINSPEKAEQVIKMAEEARTKMKEVLHQISKSKTTKDLSQLRLVLESITRSIEYSKNIAENVINMAIVGLIIIE